MKNLPEKRIILICVLTPEVRALLDGPHIANEPAVNGKRHPILKGFEETDIIPFGGLLQPLRTDAHAEVLMTFIPQFPVYPPEKAYMRSLKQIFPVLFLIRCQMKAG